RRSWLRDPRGGAWTGRPWKATCRTDAATALQPAVLGANIASMQYLVMSRGQWNPALSREHIQDAIDRFYAWHARLINEGRMQPGQRLAREARIVTQQRVIDGPFAEAKEVVGGYWFVEAGSLEEAAALLSESPCLACGLHYEVRPIEARRCSAYR